MKRLILSAIFLLPAFYACTDTSEEAYKVVTGVVLSNDKVDLHVGQTTTITATVMPESLGMGVVWSVLDDVYADVTDGTITAKAEGVTYVLATSADGSQKAACMVSVNPAGKYSVYIKDELGNPVTGIYGYPGMSEILSASTTDGETHEFTWSIENAAAGSITDDGILTLSASASTDPAFVYDAESFVKVATEDGFGCRIPLRSSLYNGIRYKDTFQAAGQPVIVRKESSNPFAVLYEGASGPIAIPADGITFDLSNTADFSIHKEAGAYSLVAGDAANGVSTKLSVSTIGSTWKVEIAEFQIGDAVDAEIDINDFASFKAFLAACQPGKTIKGKVMADVALTSSEVEEIDALYPVADFDGIVEGNHHTISGLVKPLFGVLSGKVSDLTLNSTLNITGAAGNVGVFAHSATHAILTGCVSKGSVTSTVAEVDGDLALGGLVGSISDCTLIACQNQAAVTNHTAASGIACIGGLVGVADGANTLTGTASDYNSNSGTILEDSKTLDVAVGGICGYSCSDASDFAYARNLSTKDAGDITIQNNTKNKIYVGGILGRSAVTSSLDYANNAGKILFKDLTLSATGQVFAGGIIGGWTESGVQTITGCVNSGCIESDSSDHNDFNAGDTKTPLWSCFGGIAGMGASSSSQSLNGGWNTITGKTFTNCTNSAYIWIYGRMRYCIGGVVAYTENNISGCVCTGNITGHASGGIGTVNGNYHRNVTGGVVGLFTGSTISSSKYDGTLNTNGSSPFSYDGGIIGYAYTGSITFNTCKVGGSTHGAGTGQGRSAVMVNNSNNSVTYTFTDCVIKKGTISYASGSKATINSDSDVTADHCFGAGSSNYTITGNVLPTVADSID
jgi:hypothetical protein